MGEMTILYGLMDWQWWTNGLWFVLVTGVLWWAPGYFFLKKYKNVSRATKFFLAPILGLVLLTVVAYVSGMLGIYDLIYIYEIMVAGVAGWQLWQWGRAGKIKIGQWVREVWQREKVLLILILLGLIVQLPAIFGSGLRNVDGVRFFFTNNQDGLMHLGFIESLAERWPAMRPEVNAPLQNYHYFADLLMAQLVRLGLPAANVFGQYMPLALSMLMTGIIYQAMLWVTKKKRVAIWTTLVCLLAGDGGYLLSWLIPGGKGWEMATFDNGADQFLNMPFVVAKLIFFGAWLILNIYWKEKKSSWLGLLVLLLLPLTLFKVYWLFFFLGGWGITIVVRTVKIIVADNKSWKEVGKVWWRKMGWEAVAGLVVVIGGLILLKSIASEGMSDSLLFMPWVWPREIISADHLNWREWFLREQQFVAANNWKRIWWENGKLLLVSLVFVYGARLLGLLVGPKAARTLGRENVWFMLTSVVVWTFFGLNFLQSKGGFNTFNFLILAVTALSILLGVNLACWWEESTVKKRWLRWSITWGRRVLVVVIVGLLLPRTVHNWWWYSERTWQGKEEAGFYGNELLELLEAVKMESDEQTLVAVAPANERMRRASVVPGLAGASTYLSNQFILKTHNYDYESKETKMKEIFAEIDVKYFSASLRDLGISTVLLEEKDIESMDKVLLDGIKSSLRVIKENKAGVVMGL